MERLGDCRRSLNGLAVYGIARCFQHKVDECLELAKGAAHRKDAEFWEESAALGRIGSAQGKAGVKRLDSRLISTRQRGNQSADQRVWIGR
jgi:hypothetical protein